MAIRQKNSNDMSDAEIRQMTDALDDVLAEKASKKLRHFYAWAWGFHQGVPLEKNWHIDCVAEHVEAALNRQIKRLIVTVPPRSGKTTITSISAPAFRWISHPEEKFYLSSHKLGLCTSNLIATRNIVNHPDYKNRYCNPNHEWFSFKLSDDQSTKTKISNTGKGEINISSPDTGIIGSGGTVFLIDDIIDEEMYKNESIREQRNKWVTDQLFGRTNDFNSDVRIAINQRLGDSDLVNHLHNKFIGEDCFFELCIPAEFAKRKTYFSPLGEKWNDPRKTEGQLLDKTRIPLKLLDGLDPIRRKTLFNQDPSGGGKGITISETDIRIVSQKPAKLDSMIIMWDLTFAASQASTSWNLGAVVGRKENNYYVIDGIRAKLDIVGQMAAIKKLAKKYPQAEIGVEAKANGEAVMRLLASEFPNIVPFRPSVWGGKAQADKEKRFGAVVPFIKNGQLHVYKPHLTDYTLDETYDPDHAINELVGFPLFSTNEWVDDISYAVGYLSQQTSNNVIMLFGDNNPKLTEDEYWENDRFAKKYNPDYNEANDLCIFTDTIPSAEDINAIQF